MRRGLFFAKRNLLEMWRDPLAYIFCIAFPLVMILLFAVIDYYAGGHTPIFTMPALIPGMMMFSFTFLTLLMSLLVSRDRASAFLVRLYTSPMTTADFIGGYTLPGLFVGLLQEGVCLLGGAAVAACTGGAYFSFSAALLLAASLWPMLFFSLFLGILLGCVLNDKGAPGVTSAFITMAGVLGGAWMPLDTMGAFENFCRFLPFYPAVYIGRIITGATHSITDPGNWIPAPYVWDATAWWGCVTQGLYLLFCVSFTLLAFHRMQKNGRAI